MALPRLTRTQILADQHHQQTGDWPSRLSGEVRGAPGETWLAINVALEKGNRGLKGGTTLARLLTSRREALSGIQRPRLTRSQILAWAKRTGVGPEPGPRFARDRSQKQMAKRGWPSTRRYIMASVNSPGGTPWPR